MIEWSIVIGLILLGCFLIWAEIVFVPGVFLTALVGIASGILGIYKAYNYFGSNVGTGVLVVTIALNIINIVMIFRGKSWDKFSLKETNTSKVNETADLGLEIGTIGLTVSALKPIGKAEFGNLVVEVSSEGGYVNENEEIEVINIESNKIIVKKK